MTADTTSSVPATNGTKPGTKPTPSETNGHEVTDSHVLHRNLNLTLPVVTHAKGSYLYTSSGTRILDGSGGAAVVSVGHAVPEIVDAVSAQISTLPYVSSALFAIQPAEELARRMCRDSGMERAVFLSGGSEAVESAIKLARQYHVERGDAQRTEFIAREASYHGNTIGGESPECPESPDRFGFDVPFSPKLTAALALGRHMARREFNEPLLSSHFHAISPCNAYRYQAPSESDEAYVARLASELEAKIQSLGPSNVAAFFAEPVVGAAAGCVPFVPGYLREMKKVCEKYGVLFCLDEIMCGAGRTGRLHAWMNDLPSSSLPERLGGEGEEREGWGEEVRPDIQTLGKGLCGGYAPLSAVLVSRKVCEGLEGGSGAFRNGYTFQSSGTGVAAGLAVYDYMEKHDL